jgi:hypothetical protein
MIPVAISAGVTAFQANVAASKPISGLTPLQRAVLVTQGLSLVTAVDDALASVGTALDAPDPAGHPLALIAGVRTRLTASQDATTLSDLRGLLGRAVLNLSQGFA